VTGINHGCLQELSPTGSISLGTLKRWLPFAHISDDLPDIDAKRVTGHGGNPFVNPITDPDGILVSRDEEEPHLTSSVGVIGIRQEGASSKAVVEVGIEIGHDYLRLI